MPKKAIKRLNSMCTIKRTIRKNKKNITKTSVRKMLAMTDPPKPEQPSSSTDPSSAQSNQNIDEFLSTGRTGRRNALPDILNDHSLVTSSELPSQLEALTTEDKDNTNDPNKPSTSTSEEPENNR